MSRLDFAPKAKEMEVTDISTGHFVFTPRPGKEVSCRRLSKAIEGAGYKIENALVEVRGQVLVEDGKTALKVEESGQLFWLVTSEAWQHGSETTTVTGDWSEEVGRQPIRHPEREPHLGREESP